MRPRVTLAVSTHPTTAVSVLHVRLVLPDAMYPALHVYVAPSPSLRVNATVPSLGSLSVPQYSVINGHVGSDPDQVPGTPQVRGVVPAISCPRSQL